MFFGFTQNFERLFHVKNNNFFFCNFNLVFVNKQFKLTIQSPLFQQVNSDLQIHCYSNLSLIFKTVFLLAIDAL